MGHQMCHDGGTEAPMSPQRKVPCIRCSALADPAEMLPLFSTRDAAEVASIFIHPACAQAFVLDHFQALVKNIDTARDTMSTGVADLTRVRLLKSVGEAVEQSVKKIKAADWSP